MPPFLFRGNRMEHFNKLSPSEAERLAILLEEMGEAQQAIGKILRHGYESTHPDGGETNREMLERELGDVHYAVVNLYVCNDINEVAVHEAAREKSENITKYLHHNE